MRPIPLEGGSGCSGLVEPGGRMAARFECVRLCAFCNGRDGRRNRLMAPHLDETRARRSLETGASVLGHERFRASESARTVRNRRHGNSDGCRTSTAARAAGSSCEREARGPVPLRCRIGHANAMSGRARLPALRAPSAVGASGRAATAGPQSPATSLLMSSGRNPRRSWRPRARRPGCGSR